MGLRSGLLLSIFCLQAHGIVVQHPNGISAQAKLGSPTNPTALWDALLKSNVKGGAEADGVKFNQVNYTGFDDQTFHQFIESIAASNVYSLNKNQTYAFFINAYNALAMRAVIRQPCIRTLISCEPIKSIKDIGSGILKSGNIFKDYTDIVGGRKYSLDQLEDFLRNPGPKFQQDPRLHACINCASVSCPDLRPEAYNPESIDAQMDDQMSKWMSNPSKGFKLDKKAGKVTLSKIFDWFKADFLHHGGALKFVMPYLEKESQQWIKQFTKNNTLTIDYFDYDWHLNGAAPCNCAQSKTKLAA
jgi:hypothetical protein